MQRRQSQESRGIDSRFTSNWDKYTFVDVVLHKKVSIKYESVKMLFLSKALEPITITKNIRIEKARHP